MADDNQAVSGSEPQYGSCEGPEAMYVKMISSDGHEFIIKREHALTSGTIKNMLSGPGKLCIVCCIVCRKFCLCPDTVLCYRTVRRKRDE